MDNKLESPPNPQADRFAERLKRGASVIQSDPDARLWRDEYLTGMKQSMIADAMERVRRAGTLEQFFAAQAILLAADKIGDVQTSLVTIARAPEKKPQA